MITPEPPAAPDAWWSPSENALYVHPRDAVDRWVSQPVAPRRAAAWSVPNLPADAVPLVPIRRSEEAIREAARDWFDPNDNLTLEEFEETAGDAVRFVLALLNNPVPAGAVPDTGQARETGAGWAARPRRFSPEDTLSVAEHLGAAEPSGDTVQAPDVAALRKRLDDLDEAYFARGYTRRYGSHAQIHTSEVRALLGTDTTPEARQ